eukprot:9477895-Pyramimonas_sp.AAC.1
MHRGCCPPRGGRALAPLLEPLDHTRRLRSGELWDLDSRCSHLVAQRLPVVVSSSAALLRRSKDARRTGGRYSRAS